MISTDECFFEVVRINRDTSLNPDHADAAAATDDDDDEEEEDAAAAADF